ncbi:MAG: hypothetical protein PHD21_00205 [Flavobacteriales bacterium]|nr:hypothetical protein [Flavobacteriales bacterium]
MEEINNTPAPKRKKRPAAVLLLLLVLLVGAVVYIFYSRSQFTQLIEHNRQVALEELTALQTDYDTLYVQDSKLKIEVDEAQQQISLLRDSMVNYKANLSLLRSYEKQIKRLREEKRELFHVADSLNRLNKVLIAQRDKAEDSLRKTSSRNKTLVEENVRMQADMKSASALDARSVVAQAVTVSNTGKIKDTDRARRTDQIRVSFTLVKNNFAKAGSVKVYVRVVSPDKLIGIEKGNNYFVVGNERMQFSGVKDVMYENQDLDVAVFVDGVAGDFVEGKYQVYVYAEGRQIGSTQMLLK